MREKDGFSLIELVITIAIMGILVGLSAFSLNYISQADARKMTGEINSAFSELKTLNMSKNATAYMHLYQYDGDFYIKYDGSASCTPDDTGHKIGKDNMKIQVDSTELGSGDVYSFTIRKKDGAFATVTVGGNTYVPPSKIAVTDDNGRTYSITVVKDTGRHFID